VDRRAPVRVCYLIARDSYWVIEDTRDPASEPPHRPRMHHHAQHRGRGMTAEPIPLHPEREVLEAALEYAAAGVPWRRRLLAQGETVVDVPAELAAPVRVFDTGNARKTDATDAHTVALVALCTPG
jgi:hypothetical protein